MESIRKRVEMRLVSSQERMRKLINRPTFKHSIYFSENLSEISLHIPIELSSISPSTSDFQYWRSVNP